MIYDPSFVAVNGLATHNAEDSSYFQNNYQRLQEQVVSFGGKLGESLRKTCSHIHNQIFGGKSNQQRNVLKALDEGYASNDKMRRVTNVYDLQQATTFEQRWLMTNQNLRLAVNAGRAHGYAESYNDPNPEAMGRTHRDYRIANDGFSLLDEEKPGTFTGKVVHYDEPLEEGEELSMQSKINIALANRMVDRLLDEDDIDPTSPDNNTLM